MPMPEDFRSGSKPLRFLSSLQIDSLPLVFPLSSVPVPGGFVLQLARGVSRLLAPRAREAQLQQIGNRRGLGVRWLVKAL